MPKLNVSSSTGSTRRLAAAFIITFVTALYPFEHLWGQWGVIITAWTDDAFAHPWDNPDTPEDESSDGECEDMMHRCTLRAALEEAAIIGTPIAVRIFTNGILHVDPDQGSFYLPDDSSIEGLDHGPAIVGAGGNTPVIFVVGNNSFIIGVEMMNAIVGIELAGNNSVIGGQEPNQANYIHGMTQVGVMVTGDFNSITGNVIGIQSSDDQPDGSPFGIFVTGSENVIGGPDSGKGNIISGNDKGISIYPIDTTSHNWVIGNLIGTDISGMLAVGNKVGVEVIGPNVYTSNNVISGNTESGILLGIDARNNYVVDNMIGVDTDSTGLIPNRDGVVLGPGSSDCVVRGNLIRGNTQFGISINGLPDSALTSQHHLIGNNIISDNSTAGILMSGETTDNVIGSSLSTEYPLNDIHDNGQAGIMIGGGFGTPKRNTIRENSIHDNTGFGIRILSGQGGIQPPEVDSYVDDGQGNALIVGRHPLAGAIVDIYAGDPNQSNRQEGIEWLGSGPVDASGNFTIGISSCLCDSIVTTATDVLGNTSQFSRGYAPMPDAVHDPAVQDILINAYPNPFNRKVTLELHVSIPKEVILRIYDSSGRIVETLVNGTLQAGIHDMHWNADDLAPGMYYYKCIGLSRRDESGKLFLIH